MKFLLSIARSGRDDTVLTAHVDSIADVGEKMAAAMSIAVAIAKQSALEGCPDTAVNVSTEAEQPVGRVALTCVRPD